MSGPGSHPGVVIAELTTDIDQTVQSLETALGDGYVLLFPQPYTVGGRVYAAFVQGYKGK